MADRLTGLGQSVEEYLVLNGDVTLSDLYYGAVKHYDGSRTDIVQMGELRVDDDVLEVLPDVKVLLDESAWEKVCELLRIPFAYMKRLSKYMRKVNAEFWFDHDADKDVTVISKGDLLVDIRADMEISMVDVLAIMDSVVDGAKVFRSVHKKNSTIIDVFDERVSFDMGTLGSNRVYYGGLRVEVKDGLKAPAISPMLIDEDSCSVVEFGQFLEPLNIKSLSYDDILSVIEERMDNCYGAVPRLAETMNHIWDEDVPNPRRRLQLYCREHGIPERVRAYILDRFDESGFDKATFGDIIGLFGVMGYVNEVKQSSELKLQQLAGYIVMKAHTERRCKACDATLVEE